MSRDALGDKPIHRADRPPSSENLPAVHIPASRSLAIERAAMRLVPGLFMVIVSFRVFSGLSFAVSATNNRITEYSISVLLLPVLLIGLVLSLRGVLWLAFACWPAPLRITAGRDGLTLDLGPVGSRRYPADSLDVRYLFEIPTEATDDGMSYEALLPPEQQIRELLPQMRVSGQPDPIEEQIRYYTKFSEQQLADALRPFIEYMRRDREAPGDEARGCDG